METFEPQHIALLSLGTFVVSLLVAAIGPTGGLQLAVVAALLPAPFIISVHAWITGLSAVFRSWSLHKQIDWKYLSLFGPLSTAASIAAFSISGRLNVRILQFVIGLYILTSSLRMMVDRPSKLLSRLSAPPIAGVVSGFVTVFVGATGPLLFSLMAPRFRSREELVATHSICLVIQHGAKVALFGLMGPMMFNYPLLLGSVAFASLVGTFAGNLILIAIPDKMYRHLLTVVLVSSGLLVMLRALF